MDHWIKDREARVVCFGTGLWNIQVSILLENIEDFANEIKLEFTLSFLSLKQTTKYQGFYKDPVNNITDSSIRWIHNLFIIWNQKWLHCPLFGKSFIRIKLQINASHLGFSTNSKNQLYLYMNPVKHITDHWIQSKLI